MVKKRNMALTLFAIGVFMAGLDNGIMTSALTTLTSSFHVSATWGSWSITIYTLGLSVSIPLMAKLSDMFGRKRMFLIGVAFFGLGSLLVALSHSFSWLLVSRVIQAIGGGGIFPIANGYITSTVPVERQGKALGMVGGMNGIAAILGPNIGAFILSISNNDWHWLFWINVPIALVLLLFSIRSMPESRSEVKGSFDIGGIILLSAAMLSLMYSFTSLKSGNMVASLGTTGFLGYFIAGIVLLVLLLLHESAQAKAGKQPFIPMPLLKKPELRWVLGIGATSGFILMSVIYLPAFNQMVLGWPASTAGFWYTPLAIGSAIGAMGGGAFMDKRGPIATLSIGAVSAIIGSALFPLWVVSTWQMVIASMLMGLGIGMTLGAPINFLMTRSVPNDKSTALGILSLARQFGMTLGPIILADLISSPMAKLPGKIVSNLRAIGVSPNQIPPSQMAKLSQVTSFSDVSKQVQGIPSAPVRQAILQAVHTVTRLGFDHMFWAATVVAVVCLFIILMVSRYVRNVGNTRHVQEVQPQHR